MKSIVRNNQMNELELLEIRVLISKLRKKKLFVSLGISVKKAIGVANKVIGGSIYFIFNSMFSENPRIWISKEENKYMEAKRGHGDSFSYLPRVF